MIAVFSYIFSADDFDKERKTMHLLTRLICEIIVKPTESERDSFEKNPIPDIPDTLKAMLQWQVDNLIKYVFFNMKSK